MKLNILKCSEATEPEITLKYAEETPQIENLIDTLRIFCRSIQAEKDGSNHTVTLDEIFYIESVDEKCYIYTKSDVYECKYKLYTLEEMLIDTSFIRISKNCILNIARLKSVRPFINGKFEATMQNGEKIIINRHYVSAFKKKFGV